MRISDGTPADTRLLAIAADQLREFGPKHVTVVGIADAAGMTHANVYRYFANKAALIDAVAGQWLRQMEAIIADIADSPDPADDKLERLIQAWARVHRDLLKEDRHLFDVYCSATETARPLIRKHRSRMRLLIDRVLPARAWPALIAAGFLVGWWACTECARDLGSGDPGAIVWDEVIAFWIVLWLLMPAGLVEQALAFALFRFFDAAKPGPVGWADRRFKSAGAIGWAQGFGILFDDLVAAGCTLLVLAAGRWLWS